uniref:Uncharacterized protein n=1 Tax=Anguilla anguilla TaxID=7936 RepID=A0A0E9WCI9_ANGAN
MHSRLTSANLTTLMTKLANQVTMRGQIT